MFFDIFSTCPGFWAVWSKGLKKRDINMIKNSVELQNHLAHWCNVYMNRIKWNGLPETCSGRILSLSFLVSGCAMIAKEDGGYYSLLARGGHALSLLGEPTKAWGWSVNGIINKEYDVIVPGADTNALLRKTADGSISLNFNAVLGWDNPIRYPFFNYIVNSCQRMADIRRSEDVVRNNCKRPALVVCESDANVKSVREAFEARDENASAIIVSSGNIALEGIQVFPLQIDATIMKEFADAYTREENYLNSILGIKNLPNTDKKERLITTEADSNDESTRTNGDIILNNLSAFCDTVNEAFGLNISVELNEPEEMAQSEFIDEGDDDDVLE